MRNLKKIILFLGAVSLVAFGATNFKKTEKKVKAVKKSDKKTEGKQTVQNETKTVKEEVKKSETEETQKKPAVNKTNTEKKEKERASSSK